MSPLILALFVATSTPTDCPEELVRTVEGYEQIVEIKEIQISMLEKRLKARTSTAIRAIPIVPTVAPPMQHDSSTLVIGTLGGLGVGVVVTAILFLALGGSG